MNHEDCFDETCAKLRDAASAGLLRPKKLDELIGGLRETQRRDWAVRVLDAAADHYECSSPEVTRLLHKTTHVQFRIFPFWNLTNWPAKLPTYAKSRDAARHAAALAVFPTLPDDVRSKLGECP